MRQLSLSLSLSPSLSLAHTHRLKHLDQEKAHLQWLRHSHKHYYRSPNENELYILSCHLEPECDTSPFHTIGHTERHAKWKKFTKWCECIIDAKPQTSESPSFTNMLHDRGLTKLTKYLMGTVSAVTSLGARCCHRCQRPCLPQSLFRDVPPTTNSSSSPLPPESVPRSLASFLALAFSSYPP